MFETLKSLFDAGGFMMYPLVICSFIIVFITVEKAILLRRERLIPGTGYPEWCEWFEKGSDYEHETPKVVETSVLHRIMLPLIAYFPFEESRLVERITDQFRQQRHRLEKGLVFLDTIAGIAPMFGLLGTAIGMVEVFAKLSEAGAPKMSALSSGISQALITTVFGLLIGIPALIANNMLQRHIENILMEVEDKLNEMMDHCRKQMIRE